MREKTGQEVIAMTATGRMTISEKDLEAFRSYLRIEEKSGATVEKYVRAAGELMAWLEGRELTKEAAVSWKTELCTRALDPVTVNGKLAALNSLLRYLKREDCAVKYLKVQRSIFRDAKREMTLEEYNRLLAAARKHGDTRMCLAMETICATGIRVSELKYITLEAVKEGQAVVKLKGKVRSILISGKLAKRLLQYAQEHQIDAGVIFRTRNGTPMDRRQIWAKMKAYCEEAAVDSSKVFPHNLRHLFARTHYARYHDLVCLASVLGHSSVETTRIYLITTGAACAKQLEELRLIS